LINSIKEAFIKKHASIAVKITGVLTAMGAALTLISLIALFSFFSFHVVIKELSERSIPDIIHGANFIDHISRLMSETERLASASVEPEQRIAYKNIKQEFNEISHLLNISEADSRLSEEVAMIRSTIEEFNTLVVERIRIFKASEEQFLQLFLFTENLLKLKQEIQDVDTVSKLEPWLSKAMEIINNMRRIKSVKSLYKVNKIRRSLVKDFRALQKLSLSVPNKLKSRVLDFQDAINIFLYSVDGLVNVSIKSKSTSLQSASRANFTRNLVEDFRYSNLAKFNTIVSLAAKRSNELGRGVQVLVYIFVVILVVGLLGVIVIIIHFRRNIVMRLTRLNVSILDRIAGRETEPIIISGADEITDMAQSFAYYENEVSKREDKLKEMAMRDVLTGVSNRRHFMEQAEAETIRSIRYKNDMAVLMIDIDFFKHINDTYGHHVGDIILADVASILNKGLRDEDLFGRIGGEEFAAVLIESNIEEAKVVSERLRHSIESYVLNNDGFELKCTVSIGIAKLDENERVFNDVMKRADEALYESKNNGRNRTTVSTLHTL